MINEPNCVCCAITLAHSSKTILSLMIYCVSGTLLTLMNKVTIDIFPYTNILLILQNGLALLFLFLCSRCFPQTFGSLPVLNRTALRLWLPLVFLFVMMLTSSLVALIHVSVPTVIVMRNLSTLFVSLLEYLFLRHKINRFSIVTLIGMLFGALLYARHDLTFSVRGYFWLSVNILSTSIYQIYIKKMIHLPVFETIGPIGMSYYNNLLSLPVLFVLACVTGEVTTLSFVSDGVSDDAKRSIILILLSSLLGFALSISAFALNKLISATSMMVANNVNKFSIIILSELFVKSTLDWVASIGAVSALFLGWLYSQTAKPASKTILAIITLALIIAGAAIEYRYIKATIADTDDPILINRTALHQSPLPQSNFVRAPRRVSPGISVRTPTNFSLPSTCRNRNSSIWKTCDVPHCQPYTAALNWSYPNRTIFGEETGEFINRILKIAWGANPPSVDLYLRGGCHGMMEMKYLFRSIELFWPRFLGSVIVVLDAGDQRTLDDLLPRQPTHHYVIVFESAPCLPGRVFNQYSYLNLDRHSRATYVVTVDSDCIFHSPVTPDLIFRQGKVILSSSRTFQLQMWRRTQEAMMGEGMYDAHYMVTQPVTFALSTFQSFREWFYQSKGKCYEDQLAQLSPVYYQEFCWMCQLGTYLERGHPKESEAHKYWFQHMDDPIAEPILRYAIHVPYEPYNSTRCHEPVCYEKTANEVIIQGLCRAFGSSVFHLCANHTQMQYINKMTFSYVHFEIQAADKLKRITALTNYLQRLAIITDIAFRVNPLFSDRD